LSGTFSASSFVADAGLGALGGAVAGQVVPYVFKNFVSHGVKGAIGEGLTELDLLLNGETIAIRGARNGVGKSTFDFLLTSGEFVESKFGTSQLSAAQRLAARIQGGNLQVQYWTYPTVSGISGAGIGAGFAGWLK